MNGPSAKAWTAAIGVLIVVGIVALASCQSYRWLRPPYHEPALAPR